MNENVDINKKQDIVSILLHPVHADQQWKQTAKEVLEAREMQECTFKPKIKEYFDPTSTSRLGTRKPTDKCTELYMKAKPTRERKDKTKQEREYEKAASECTFKPNIAESQKNLDIYFTSQIESQFSGASELTQNIKGYQMVTSRMKKGREEREKVKEMLTRGIPGTARDEAQFNPLSFSTNNNYKSSFSSYSIKPQTNPN